MNLHGTVRGAITSVNPDIFAAWQENINNTVDAAGNQYPVYNATVMILVQVQAVPGNDLQAIAGVNYQGVLRVVYCYGNKQGVVRTSQKGGDLLSFAEVPNPNTNPVRTWLVKQVLETWPDWSKVLVELQQ